MIDLVSAGGNKQIRAAARNTVVSEYDLRKICLPAYLSLLQDLTQGRKPVVGRDADDGQSGE
jgi:hypothetical protein